MRGHYRTMHLVDVCRPIVDSASVLVDQSSRHAAESGSEFNQRHRETNWRRYRRPISPRQVFVKQSFNKVPPFMAIMRPEVDPEEIPHDSERLVYIGLRDQLSNEYIVLHSYPWLRP